MTLKTVINLMQICLGIIFLWYGGLKLFDGVSPAQELATTTIGLLSFHTLSSELSIKLLAVFEILIGFGFIFGIFLRFTLCMFFIHMIGTFTPLFILTEVSFNQAPYAFSLVGQYIMKNVIFVLAGMCIYYFNKENKYEKIYS